MIQFPLLLFSWALPLSYSVLHQPAWFFLDKVTCIHLKPFVLTFSSVWSAFLPDAFMVTSIRPSMVTYLRLWPSPQPSPPCWNFIYLFSIYHYCIYHLTYISATPRGWEHFSALTTRPPVLTQRRHSVDNCISINSLNSTTIMSPDLYMRKLRLNKWPNITQLLMAKLGFNSRLFGSEPMYFYSRLHFQGLVCGFLSLCLGAAILQGPNMCWSLP